VPRDAAFDPAVDLHTAIDLRTAVDPSPDGAGDRV
jgi:hypothetical protein